MMSMKKVFVVLGVLFVGGLGLNYLLSDKPTTLPPLGRVTIIKVVGPSANTFPFRSKVWNITDPNQISKIVAFVDKQQSDWYPPFLAPIPSSDIALVFYNGKKEKRVFGIGSQCFIAGSQSEPVCKGCSPQEKRELLQLIVPKKQQIIKPSSKPLT